MECDGNEKYMRIEYSRDIRDDNVDDGGEVRNNGFLDEVRCIMDYTGPDEYDYDGQWKMLPCAPRR